ncbi:bifunctional diaminohydroxyphosphoribosylaminopyrimidine deaminase/5-amino-6-(5-phosphoribosylamino)uracil reductase RibD [Salisediminibacterium halotolerans]|uniref:bifunctional diaminohydroxyphosphoribosylaminopyrimidine deaminase/5-amino-6-(5-phosphoribosylamino)uracil reductase RibD n=1 Tax=Salisediminibacterium halotolerans TaxID=517425 RepID=UPI000EB4499D|nr:bifunctional diaminohydroxyphosphoribosylaminopyrimidine deaminase/5-amino-6-(5-phosphoribosylamino)uracil reductase RibD [Salisediminibacterium halotolerans]RLJ78001.1 diaminohydroxyphosphoribosylaminopyrimidine deaminase/5-amino-6-(5-phosphoribosylamino)uracil reductase [Actinophytocola xinjiangensis]RPE88661.1 diaminohydroxyphosphoribosylaminopyrimidine deaminase/5-amino-6-(5-phosphoribosylamino)uracil reductase [Salisediminibacterium halotolerans]TWG36978.1 diaminohydroxyphosphoribosylami
MDEEYMKLAIELARKTKGQTSPNPLVGCVIVNNGDIVGMAAHLKAGELHAERLALQMAGDKAYGADAYVTLEPCAHHGRTPPCADALIDSGIKRVVIASDDPNPKVSGRGYDRLYDAGIEVERGCLKEEADTLNEIFFHYIKTKKPYVTMKLASSIDGKIATTSGESQWITGEEAREDGHRLRKEHDAILVGVNTVIADDPSLTTRLPGGGKHPVRIILDRHLRTPLNAKVLNDEKAPTWIVTSMAADSAGALLLKEKGAKILSLDPTDVAEVLERLAEKDVTSLLVEGGGMINDSFLRAGLFNQVVHYLAPILLGGKDAKSSFSGEGIHHLPNAEKLTLTKQYMLGSDIKFIYKRGMSNVYRDR